jgi:hypothetical protein
MVRVASAVRDPSGEVTRLALEVDAKLRHDQIEG